MRVGLAILLLLLAGAARCSTPDADASAQRRESQLLGRGVPDIALALADGSRTRLSTLAGGKPLLVAFFYRRCTGICTPFLQWLRDAASEVGGLGADYRVLALSFDQADAAADLRAQAQAMGLIADPNWTFATTSREDLARVTGALDFWYRYDEASGQYDHTALLVALGDSRVLGAVTGTPDSARRLRELLWTLRGKFIASYRLEGAAPLACLVFDPKTGAMRLDWGSLLLAAPGAGALTCALGVFGGVRRRRLAGRSTSA